MTLQDELRAPGFIHDNVSYRAADRIDVLEAALRRIDERMNYPFGPSDFDRIRNIARGALGESS